MSKVNIFDELYARDKSPLDFNFESLWLPDMTNYLSIYDIDALYNVASSVRYAGNINMKYKRIDEIMTSRNFRKFATGTNRTVYKCMEDTRFLAKIALDRVGLSDSPKEFNNQIILKPFVAKVFQVDPSGTVATVERVDPITSKEEFSYIAEDVFDLLVNCIIGQYVLEDIGTKYYMNWGVRKGFGPCLLDYPYLYELDGEKLFCNLPIIPGTKFPLCGGEIDYDKGFNRLVCSVCGKEYNAQDLQTAKLKNLIIIKGEECMNVRLKRGNTVIHDPFKASSVIKQDNVKFKKDQENINRVYAEPRLVRGTLSPMGIHAQAAEKIYPKTDTNKLNNYYVPTASTHSEPVKVTERIIVERTIKMDEGSDLDPSQLLKSLGLDKEVVVPTLAADAVSFENEAPISDTIVSEKGEKVSGSYEGKSVVYEETTIITEEETNTDPEVDENAQEPTEAVEEVEPSVDDTALNEEIANEIKKVEAEIIANESIEDASVEPATKDSSAKQEEVIDRNSDKNKSTYIGNY